MQCRVRCMGVLPQGSSRLESGIAVRSRRLPHRAEELGARDLVHQTGDRGNVQNRNYWRKRFGDGMARTGLLGLETSWDEVVTDNMEQSKAEYNKNVGVEEG